MGIGQKLYLEYIRRRREKKEALDGPPIPYEIFKQIWDDRRSYLMSNATAQVGYIDQILYIEDEYNDDGRSLIAIGGKVLQTDEGYWWE